MMVPPTKAAKPMDADCTAELMVMKVPRKRGSTADEIKAMPGIMRAFMQKNKLADTNSTTGKVGEDVLYCMPGCQRLNNSYLNKM